MPYSYDPLLPTARDRARLSLGDTGQVPVAENAPIWLLPDETIDALISAEGFAEGVAQAADALVARFAQEPDKLDEGGDGGLRIEWGQRLDAWRALADRLRRGTGVGRSQASARIVAGVTKGPDLGGLRL